MLIVRPCITTVEDAAEIHAVVDDRGWALLILLHPAVLSTDLQLC